MKAIFQYSCDLLEKSYLCGINNNLKKFMEILL